jgi:hydroxyacyl-ACP dehydratase HTD2-like protein with hotdog domain
MTGSGDHVTTAVRCPFLEDVEDGQTIEQLTRGPLLPPHLMRWSAAIENWHRIHYDQPYAVSHEGLPGLLINGSWKQHFVLQLLRRWAGPTGWVWTVDFQFRAMNLVGETLTAWGRVRSAYTVGEFGLVELDTGIANQDGKESTPGTARVLLPRRGGPALPADKTALLAELAALLRTDS